MTALMEDAEHATGIETLIRHQLENLQRIIELESGAAPVRIDGFVFGAPSPGVRPATRVRRESPAVYRHVEPRLTMIAAFLNHVQQLGRFEANGLPVEVAGFSLKNLHFWSSYPATRLIDNFGELSTWCSCDCGFCFLRGSEMLSPKRPMLTAAEARTRARYNSVERRTGLPVPSAPPGEPLANPRAIELLRIARTAHPGPVIDITTNGDFLTEKTVDALAELKPLHISLSLNSSDPQERRRSMRSHRAEVAIRAVPMLRDRGIQFTGSIVPSVSAPLSDVAQTMEYLDRFEPIQIRLLLPGFTRHALPEEQFDTPTFWNSLLSIAAEMRSKLRSPLLIQPGYYWNRSIAAIIDGIFPNSPAEAAGLHLGDRIVSVNGNRVLTRAEAGQALEEPPQAGSAWAADVEVERGGRRWTVHLSNELAIADDRYPYKPAGYESTYEVMARWGFGIQLMDGFDLEPLGILKQIVSRHPEARHVLLFTTPLVKDLYLQALQIVGTSPECALPEEVELRVTIAPQSFWGGNIIVGDLHVVQDYIDHLETLARAGYRPDLVIIPNSFADSWGQDLLCRSYLEVERAAGVAVELLPVRRVMV